MAHKIGAEIAQSQTAFAEPAFRFFRRDQVVLITKLFRRGIDRGVVELEILFLGPALRRQQPEQVLPFGLQFAAENGSIGDVAPGKRTIFADKNDLALDQGRLV